MEGREAIEVAVPNGEETKNIEGNKPVTEMDKAVNFLGNVWDTTVKGVGKGFDAASQGSK